MFFKRGKRARLRIGAVSDIDIERNKRARRQLVEVPGGCPPLKLDEDTAFIFMLFPKVDALNASCIHNWWVLAQHLMLVNMTKRDIIDAG